jgi:hypothetical protein
MMVAGGAALSLAALLSGCSGATSPPNAQAAAPSSPLATESGIATAMKSGDGIQPSSVPLYSRCPITVTVTAVAAQSSTRYALGDTIAVRVGDRLAIASLDHCSPTLKARTQFGGPLQAVTDLPGVFTAVSVGSADLTITHAMCDGIPATGCRGGIVLSNQSVEVAGTAA